MRTIFVYLALLTSFLGFSQTPIPQDEIKYSPGGKFDTVFDNDGNKFLLKDIVISNDTTKVVSFNTCNSGYFKLYFEIGSGFEQSNSTHQLRRNVLCQLFYDLSQFITPVNPNTPVNIFVRSFLNNNNNTNPPPANVGAYASSVYLAPAITTNIGGGIVDNAIWQTINSGVDPLIAFNPPIGNLNSASAGFYHGIIAFNFNSPNFAFHQSLTPCPSTLLDLYSTGLHEITHALGFGSLINGNGQSKFGSNYPYFSRYDKFLQTTSGTNLITNTNGCGSLIGYRFNPILNTSILINNGTICTTPNLIKFGGSVNQNVYTFPAIIPPSQNPQFEPGSALSHFEDQCHSPNTYPDNSYYVMANGSFIPNSNPLQFYSKRYLKEEERKVLCDIGYKVSNVFGSYPYPNTTQCGGNQIVGVNDGITYNPSANTYTYVIANNSPALPISNFLLNDYNPNSSLTLTYECPESVFGYGTAAIVDGNTISYTPNGSGDGLDLIRYVPILQNGQKGNITYIYVYVTTASCGAIGACESYVNNGNFEQCLGCGSLSGNYPTLINPCWNKFSDTPDIWSLANPACQAVQYTYPQPLVNSWNSLNSNTHFLGLNSSKGFYIDGFQNNLTSPLVPTIGYYVKFKAKVSNHILSQNNSTFVVIGGSTASTPISSPYYTSFPPPIQNLGSVLISGNNWQDYQIHIPNTLITSNINYLTIINAIYLSPNFSSYLMIDDITIVEENANNYFTPPSIVCTNDPIDLNIHTNVPNCIFTINGVVGSVFNPAILGLGSHNVTCTYTKPNGCVVTFLATIEYKSPTISPLFNQIAPICIGSNTNPLPNTSLNGITGTWSPTFNNSATTTYTFTPSTGFCATTTTMTIQVSSGCCVTPIATYNNQINASVLASITSGQTVEINSNVIVSSNSTFNGINFRLGSNVKIIVNSGITLNLTNCTLYSCTSMWDGIEILAGGILNLNGTRIEDAKEAVKSLSASGGTLTVTNCRFNKNKTGIHLENWASFIGSNSINGTTFDCTSANSPTQNSFLKAPYPNQKSHFGLYLINNGSITIGGTTSNSFQNIEIGAYVQGCRKVNFFKNTFYQINASCPVPQACTSTTTKGWCIFSLDNGEIVVGDNTNSAMSNNFFSSDNGIAILNTKQFGVYNNSFSNIAPNGFISFGLYIGNYAGSGNLPGGFNFIQNNTFTNFNRGVYYTNNYSNSLTISQNKMSSFNATSSSGINIFENSRPQTILIEKNIFNDQTNQLGQVAINIQRVGAIDGSNITIKRNTIRNVKNGIRITSHHNVKIIENSSNFTSIGTTKAGIYFPTSVPTSLTTGIKLEDCKGTLVKSNTIQRTNYTTSPFNGYSELTNTQALDMVGIYVGENCFNTSVIDNSALKLGTGIYFIGNNNSPITLRCNFMKFNPTGLHMNGFIGDQGNLTTPQDNQWSIVTPGAKGIITNGSAPQFFTRSLSMPFMPNPTTQFQPPTLAITIMNASGGYSCVEGCANPPCALPGGLLQAMTTTGEYVLLSEQELKTLDIELYKSLKITPYTYDEYSEEGAKYQEFMDSMGMTNANKIYELEEELATKDTISAQQKLDAFEAYGDVEQNYKKVFEVYINTWMKGKYELEAQDSSYLREIANQSPRVAGNAVYMARVMLSIDTIDTETYYAKSMTQSNSFLFDQLKLYPNPGNEFIHYQLPIIENEKGMVRILDVSGKVIDEWSVDNENTIGSVDVSQYSIGIYLFDLQLTNGKSIVKKMVVK